MGPEQGCCGGGLRLDPAVREDARRRLLSVRGHVEAVHGALDKVGAMVLRSHLLRHVVTAVERGDEDRIVSELLELLKYR